MSDEVIEPRKRVLPDKPAAISSLIGELSENKKRVRVTVEFTCEDTRPDLDMRLFDATGSEICRATIIEVFGPMMAFTMHIRSDSIPFPLTLQCQLNYIDEQIESEKRIIISG